MTQTLDLTLNVSETTVIPRTAEHKRRLFLTPIAGEPGNFLAVIDNTALEKVVRCPTAGRNYIVIGREPHADRRYDDLCAGGFRKRAAN